MTSGLLDAIVSEALGVLAPKHVTRDYRPEDAAADKIRKAWAALRAERDAAREERDTAVRERDLIQDSYDEACEDASLLAAREAAAAERTERAEKERDEWANLAGRDIGVALERAEHAEAERSKAVMANRALETVAKVLGNEKAVAVERARTLAEQIKKADDALALAQLPCECNNGGECYCTEYPPIEQIKIARAALAVSKLDNPST